MMEPTTKVAAVNTRLEAELAVAQLAEAGIDAFIVADNAGGTFPMMQMVTGGYKVMVLTAVADEATEVLGPMATDTASTGKPPGVLEVLRGFTPRQLVILAFVIFIVAIPLTAYTVRVLLF
ncbi:MAG: hypothetical protein QNJ89_12915 [Acidimicrobiia bacterium]|nr:hypothetical protein [Acidimicrobiia bacterium]